MLPLRSLVDEKKIDLPGSSQALICSSVTELSTRIELLSRVHTVQTYLYVKLDNRESALRRTSRIRL